MIVLIIDRLIVRHAIIQIYHT